MKKFLYLMLFVVALACSGPFIIKGPDGKPLMTTKTIMPDDHSTVWVYWKNKLVLSYKMLLRQGKSSMGIEEPVPAVYKWQDENGVWHYGDNLAAKEVANPNEVTLSEGQIINIDTPINKQDDKAKQGGTVRLQQSVDTLKEPLEKAEKAKQALEDRSEELEKL
ncbi:DUF4124 domain-containing protein [Corallincola platygyrae]|uniref:DUF4124 domain-containing protein n=1 Tax=Corallincola platygyrae TaxID=1193278 RepID=A0ABW4XK12_9GAMM